VRVKVPLEDEFPVPIDVDMPGAVVALPSQKDIVLAADLAHLNMLPPVVPLRKAYLDGAVSARFQRNPAPDVPATGNPAFGSEVMKRPGSVGTGAVE